MRGPRGATSMGSDERELEELLRIKKQRLAELNKQVARLGYEAPPHLVNERNDLRAEIETDKKALEPVIKGELSDEALAALRAYGLPSSISNAIMLINTGLGDLKDEVREFRDQSRREKQADHTERIDRQKQTDEGLAKVNRRVSGVARLVWLLVIGAIVTVTYFVATGSIPLENVLLMIGLVVVVAAVIFWLLKD